MFFKLVIQRSKPFSQSSVSFLGTNIDKIGEILHRQDKEKHTRNTRTLPEWLRTGIS